MNLPYPPIELRKSVGPTDESFFDNPKGDLVFANEIPSDKYEKVFDFGCGCGRIARQLMLQKNCNPIQYVGVDLFQESIEWCQTHLSSHNSNYEFYHHNVFNAQFNPNAGNMVDVFPVNQKFTLVNAHSVFTHITEPNLDHYLSECAKILESKGVFRATWFLFDKSGFPMMQEFQNGIYINLNDPTNATIFDYKYIESLYEKYGLTIYKIIPPAVRGFQWTLFASPSTEGIAKAHFPDDVAPTGIRRPPVSIR